MPRGGKRNGAGRKGNSSKGSGESDNIRMGSNEGVHTQSRQVDFNQGSESNEIKEESKISNQNEPKEIENESSIECNGINKSPLGNSDPQSEHERLCPERTEARNNQFKEDSKVSNQNEPKEINQTKDELKHGICEGKSDSSIGRSFKKREAPRTARTASEGLCSDSSREHSTILEDSQGSTLRSSDSGELRVHGKGQGETRNSEPLDQQIYSSDTSSSSSSSEHPEQQRPATSSDGQAARLSEDEQIKLLRDPVHFGETFCTNHKYTFWQRAFLNDCRVIDEAGMFHEWQWPRTVVLAAVNGAGKTEIIADVIRYLLTTVPDCFIACTSPIYRQLEMLENYIKAQNHKFPNWTCIEGKLTSHRGNQARWFATDSPTSVESFHSKFLVRIIEEAKAFPDEIFDQTNRWQPKLTIIVSSKGLTRGRFYEALTKDRMFNRVHEVDASMCPWIPQKWIEEQITQRGRDSSLIKSMILNEFSDVDVRNLINLEQINRCFKNPQAWRNPGFRVGGIDLSAAKQDGDKMVGVCRQGNKLFEPYFVPTCKSTMEAIGYITNWIKREKLKLVFVDNGGLGGVTMIDHLIQNMEGDQSVQIHRVNFGSPPLNDQSFCKNRGTELWSVGQHKIEMRDLIFDWKDSTKSQFITEVTSREVITRDTGEIQLQPKHKMSSSPDLADATFLSLIEPAYETKSITGLGKTYWKDYKDNSENSSFGKSSSGRSYGRG